MSEIEIWTQIVSTVGFPIVLTFYLMFKFEKTIKQNTDALNALRSCIMQKNKKGVNK